MKRVLVIRLLALELGPMIAVIGISAYCERLMAPLCLAAALVIFTSVILSIRDGAVLEMFGYVCERKTDPRWFWLWLFAHFSFALFFLAAATLIFWRP